MKNLIIPIKKEWFDMIRSGEKDIEYREITSRYHAMLTEGTHLRQLNACLTRPERVIKLEHLKDFEYLELRNGYVSHVPTSYHDIRKIDVGKGKLDWGSKPDKYYFRIHIRSLEGEKNIK